MTGRFGLFERLSVPQQGMCSIRLVLFFFCTEKDIGDRLVKSYALAASCVTTTQSRQYSSTLYHYDYGAENRLG